MELPCPHCQAAVPLPRMDMHLLSCPAVVTRSESRPSAAAGPAVPVKSTSTLAAVAACDDEDMQDLLDDLEAEEEEQQQQRQQQQRQQPGAAATHETGPVIVHDDEDDDDGDDDDAAALLAMERFERGGPTVQRTGPSSHRNALADLMSSARAQRQPSNSAGSTRHPHTGVDKVSSPLRTGPGAIVSTARPGGGIDAKGYPCLDSAAQGLGKTFIAAVVMYNFWRWYPNGKVLFMAPTKPLVAQQVNACYQIMGFRAEDICEMTGSKQHEHRDKLWQRKRVFFLTPQCAVRDLQRGYFSAREVVCVVFDEAHRALGNHAYSLFIQSLLAESSQFRVMALSATPGDSVTKVQEVITNLLIDAIEIRGEEAADVAPYVNQRTAEKVVVPMSPDIEACRSMLNRVAQPFIKRLVQGRVLGETTLDRLTSRMLAITRDRARSGDIGGGALKKGVLENSFAMLMSLSTLFGTVSKHGITPFLISVENGIDKAKYIGKELQKNPAAQAVIKRFREQRENNPDFVGHPKLVKLRDILHSHFTAMGATATRAMVFSTIRDSVQDITDVLNRHGNLIRAVPFIGQGKGTGTGKGLTQKEQARVLQQFKNGQYNVLVATCVAEEGLDIGDVDLIVCYDQQGSQTRLVQRSGRTGRKRDGKIVFLMTANVEESLYKRSADGKNHIFKAIVKGSNSFKMSNLSPALLPAQPVVQRRQMAAAGTPPSEISGRGARRRADRGNGHTTALVEAFDAAQWEEVRQELRQQQTLAVVRSGRYSHLHMVDQFRSFLAPSRRSQAFLRLLQKEDSSIDQDWASDSFWGAKTGAAREEISGVNDDVAAPASKRAKRATIASAPQLEVADMDLGLLDTPLMGHDGWDSDDDLPEVMGLAVVTEGTNSKAAAAHLPSADRLESPRVSLHASPPWSPVRCSDERAAPAVQGQGFAGRPTHSSPTFTGAASPQPSYNDEEMPVWSQDASPPEVGFIQPSQNAVGTALESGPATSSPVPPRRRVPAHQLRALLSPSHSHPAAQKSAATLAGASRAGMPPELTTKPTSPAAEAPSPKSRESDATLAWTSRVVAAQSGRTSSALWTVLQSALTGYQRSLMARASQLPRASQAGRTTMSVNDMPTARAAAPLASSRREHESQASFQPPDHQVSELCSPHLPMRPASRSGASGSTPIVLDDTHRSQELAPPTPTPLRTKGQLKASPACVVLDTPHPLPSEPLSSPAASALRPSTAAPTRMETEEDDDDSPLVMRGRRGRPHPMVVLSSASPSPQAGHANTRPARGSPADVVFQSPVLPRSRHTRPALLSIDSDGPDENGPVQQRMAQPMGDGGRRQKKSSIDATALRERQALRRYFVASQAEDGAETGMDNMDEDEPDEYDLDDSFIDNGSASQHTQRTSPGSRSSSTAARGQRPDADILSTQEMGAVYRRSVLHSPENDELPFNTRVRYGGARYRLANLDAVPDVQDTPSPSASEAEDAPSLGPSLSPSLEPSLEAVSRAPPRPAASPTRLAAGRPHAPAFSSCSAREVAGDVASGPMLQGTPSSRGHARAPLTPYICNGNTPAARPAPNVSTPLTPLGSRSPLPLVETPMYAAARSRRPAASGCGPLLLVSTRELNSAELMNCLLASDINYAVAKMDVGMFCLGTRTAVVRLRTTEVVRWDHKDSSTSDPVFKAANNMSRLVVVIEEHQPTRGGQVTRGTAYMRGLARLVALGAQVVDVPDAAGTAAILGTLLREEHAAGFGLDARVKPLLDIREHAQVSAPSPRL
ncbi:uncharacterized protein MONBRDRAFT_30349 [Monosiga brevicollis MX1]|uniref:Fanconi anemia group M protein n=1 Tax=Monosiga brevicollis TaxID=81824 RepID=A9VDQ5_MONBE|nr:uncharacterized protein MONBRDRAFT_30349 [Monosiga brevicollis MX1]EDQ84343.1 predicted protein [Monosiga brevicollis MX1]|eukprot:XP_001750839.1 hypothetical protein [Monosiga brevicollis MX1]